MQKKNWLIFALLGIFVFSIIGCDSQKAVVQENDKKGMTAQERKEKRGE